MSIVLEFEIDDFDAGGRLDKTLAQIQSDYSRSRIQALIEEGALTLNGAVFTKASWKLSEGDKLVLTVPDAVSAEPEPEDIPLDIVYEDEEYVTSYMILGIFLFLFGLRIIFLYI